MPWYPTDHEAIRFHLQLPSTPTVMVDIELAMTLAKEEQIVTAQQAICHLDDLTTDLMTLQRDKVMEMDTLEQIRTLKQAIDQQRQILLLSLGEFGAELTAQAVSGPGEYLRG